MNTEVDFAGLGLAEPLLRAISEEGYTQPTPIQQKAIPLVMAGRDLLAAADGFFRGWFAPVIDTTFPLADAASAHERLEAGSQFGKIVLTVDAR